MSLSRPFRHFRVIRRTTLFNNANNGQEAAFDVWKTPFSFTVSSREGSVMLVLLALMYLVLTCRGRMEVKETLLQDREESYDSDGGVGGVGVCGGVGGVGGGGHEDDDDDELGGAYTGDSCDSDSTFS
ncbi:Protein of unknown function [Gryllus bimaculatus]|nr:Protein of unknown function [Gryllus bimaculatus]